MEPNTPETQPFPYGDPIDGNPVQDHPIQEGAVPASVSKPARPKGPNAAPVVLGLVALAMAALIIVTETMDVRVDWSRLGPGAIIGVGALLVVLGAIGLVRRHDSD